jgi:hypothetical protein
MLDPEKGCLDYVGADLADGRVDLRGRPVPLGEGIAGWVAANRRSWLSPVVEQDPPFPPPTRFHPSPRQPALCSPGARGCPAGGGEPVTQPHPPFRRRGRAPAEPAGGPGGRGDQQRSAGGGLPPAHPAQGARAGRAAEFLPEHHERQRRPDPGHGPGAPDRAGQRGRPQPAGPGSGHAGGAQPGKRAAPGGPQRDPAGKPGGHDPRPGRGHPVASPQRALPARLGECHTHRGRAPGFRGVPVDLPLDRAAHETAEQTGGDDQPPSGALRFGGGTVQQPGSAGCAGRRVASGGGPAGGQRGPHHPVEPGSPVADALDPPAAAPIPRPPSPPRRARKVSWSSASGPCC